MNWLFSTINISFNGIAFVVFHFFHSKIYLWILIAFIDYQSALSLKPPKLYCSSESGAGLYSIITELNIVRCVDIDRARLL